MPNFVDRRRLLPSQTNHAGKTLTTDGREASWGDAPSSLPTQTGNAGKILSTNGSTATWTTPGNRLLYQSPLVGIPWGGPTFEEAPYSYILPANTLPPLGQLRIVAHWGSNSDSNSKPVHVRFGGTSIREANLISINKTTLEIVFTRYGTGAATSGRIQFIEFKTATAALSIVNAAGTQPVTSLHFLSGFDFTVNNIISMTLTQPGCTADSFRVEQLA